jgi:hypothetical protein
MQVDYRQMLALNRLSVGFADSVLLRVDSDAHTRPNRPYRSIECQTAEAAFGSDFRFFNSSITVAIANLQYSCGISDAAARELPCRALCGLTSGK